MKNWFWIPLAAIVGGIVGSWGPREDLRLYKEQVQEEQSNRKVSDAAGFGAFARLTNIPDVASRRPQARTNAVTRTVEKSAASTNAVAEADKPPKPERAHEPPLHQRHSPEDMRARLEEAADFWNTRVEIARTQWKEKLNITDEKASEAFDSVLLSMNESIHDTMQTVADEIAKAGKMNVELSMRMMGELARTVSEAYDAIGAALPVEQRGTLSDMPAFEFIDPMVAEPLIGVQDKLDGRFGGFGL